MNNFVKRGLGCGLLLLVAGLTSVAAQPRATQQALTLPATGTFDQGGQFEGTISITRFERRNNGVVAIAFVSGVLSRSGRTLGTAVAGEIAWPVRVSAGPLSLVSNRVESPRPTMRTARSFGVRPIGLMSGTQETCPVLHVELGPNTVDLLGAQVAFAGTAIDLVCEASELLGNVAGIVNLLNNILALLTGALGGLTGGLGGGTIPVQ